MRHGLMVAVVAVLLTACEPAMNASADVVEQPVAAPLAPADAPWNTQDADAMTNGNIGIAAAKYLRGDDLVDAEATFAEVIKAPWDFYGKRLCFRAEAGQVEDMPPGSDMAVQLGGAVGEIVALTADQHIIDMIVIGGTGSLEAGARLNMCGLVAGRTEVPNRVGGTFRHLVMVGRLKPDA